MTAVIVSAIVVGTGLALAAVSRGIGRDGSVPGLVTVVAVLLFAVWVPADVRDWGVAIIAGLLVLGSARLQDRPNNSSALSWWLLACLTFGAILAIGMLPGGTSAAALSLVTVAGVVRVRSHIMHLARIRRAGLLEPGRRPDREVQTGGVVSGPVVAPPPGTELDGECAWWVILTRSANQSAAAQRWVTSGPLRLRTTAGTVLAQLDEGECRFSPARTRVWQHAGAGALRDLLDHAAPGPEEDAGPSKAGDLSDSHFTLHWLAPGDVASVLGRPEWERGPDDMAGYRDAPVVPVFRGHDVYLTDVSVDRARKNALWSVIAWLVWSPVCGAVATMQLLGLL